MENLMENLNKEQLKAVMHKDGPLLIVAGAGTGKTTVISQKIAYMVEQGWAEAHEILALTFTEKAAGEMEERVDRLLPMGYLDLWISTFHSFGERILREHGIDIGLPGDFKLLNEYEQYALFQKNLNKFQLDYYKPQGNPTKFIRALLSHFSRAKDEDISPQDYLAFVKELKKNKDNILAGKKIKNFKIDISNFFDSNGEIDGEIVEQEIIRISEIANAYSVYQQLLLDNSFLDFGDLINYCLKLFRDRPAILNKYRKQFKYILLDEFQDTNWTQYELIKILASPKNNLVVVGDDDQCLPGSSMIMTDNGKIRIDKIKKGTKVLTAVGRGYLSYSDVDYVKKNKKKVTLITFKTVGGREISATNNHKMFCFVPTAGFKKNMMELKNVNQYYYVYLMHKQELGWRIGITSDLLVRLRQERSADRIVAIGSYATEEEARYHEALYSLRYGIPTVCFYERRGIMTRREWSERLYEDLDVNSGVEALANDFGVDLSAHQVCLDAVNRGEKTRIKINIEMCCRKYHTKFAKGAYINKPQVTHLLSVETSNKEIIDKLKKSGYIMTKARKGYRYRISSVDLPKLGKIAKHIQKITSGIIENRMKIGKLNIAHKNSLVIPAGNIFEGMFIPVVTEGGVVYDQIISRVDEKKTLTVYDLEINKTHNFVADDVVVHNSVYKFRGASVSNIMQFKSDYNNASQIFLNNNYRNKQNILDLSYDFIKHNDPNRLEYVLNQDKAGQTKLNKKLIANEKGQGVIELIEGADLNDEVKKVIEKIIELKIKDKEAQWSDFAILVRANNSAKDFCAYLDQAELPYQVLSSRGLYSKPIIINLISYLRLLDDYHESTAVYRVIDMPIFNFSYKELVNFNYWARKKSWSLYEVLRSVQALNLGSEIKTKVDKFLSLVDKHTELARNKNVSELIFAFLNDSGYLKHLTHQDDEKNIEAVGLLNQFMKRIKEFEAVSDEKNVKVFLLELQMEIEAGEEGTLPVDMDTGPDSIKIMTVHAAKGLEFKYVFITNMVDKRFPTIERKEPIPIPDALVKEALPEGDVHLEEERRLLYVAITRAKAQLYFSWASDYGGARAKKPSRFLLECNLISDSQKSKVKKVKLGDSKVLNEPDAGRSQKKFQEPCEINIPSYFSFTQLAGFSNCPYQYYFSHILKIPCRGKAQFSFGKTMHSTLQKMFEASGVNQVLGQSNLFEKSGADKNSVRKTPLSLDQIYDFYEKSWIDDWYQSKQEKQEYKDKGKVILEGFFEKYKDEWPQVELLEKGFNIKIEVEGQMYTIRGVMDRVDYVDGKIKIVDYKTGSPKEKLDFDEKEQLLLYQIAAKEVFGREVKSLAFYYLNNNTEIEFLGSDEDLEKVKDKIRNSIREIKKCEFIPKPGPLCKFCDFSNICEFRKI